MKKKIVPKNTTHRQIFPKNLPLIVSKILYFYHIQEPNRVNYQNNFCEKKNHNITRNKSKFRILKKTLSLKKTLTSKTFEDPIKKIISEQQKAKQTKKYINKRNISGLKKIPTTSTCSYFNNNNNNNNINKTMNNGSLMGIQLNENNKKYISLKILKKQILNGPNSTKENYTQNYNNINKKHGMNTMLTNYLGHKNNYSEVNSVLFYNNSMSNCNTTCNTHTNSNNKNNSINHSIFKKYSHNIIGLKLNTSKIKSIIDKTNKIKINFKNQMIKKDKDDYKVKNLLHQKKEKDIMNVKEYIDDILYNLLYEEKNSEIKISNSYFKFQTDINNKMRAILLDWLIEVHLKFNFKQETLYITIQIIDSYLSLRPIKRCNFQLLGVTALVIACKQNEIFFHKLKEYCYITDNAYTEDDIKDMEYKILTTLNFNILNPSSLSFYEILGNKFGLDQDKKKFNLGLYIMESFYLDEACLKYNPSTIATTVQYIVMKYFKMENYKDCYKKALFNIKKIDEFENKFGKSNNYCIHVIKECAKDICYVINELPKGNLRSTIKKYSSDNFDNVTSLLYGNLESIN